MEAIAEALELPLPYLLISSNLQKYTPNTKLLPEYELMFDDDTEAPTRKSWGDENCHKIGLKNPPDFVLPGGLNLES
jgi:hypothetical protein